MTEQIKSREQLKLEISYLREQNQVLSAELAFHKKMFQRVSEALGAANRLSLEFQENDAVRHLAEENIKLKSQLKYAQLSDREKEILKHIAKGYTSKEIAIKLNISKLTVDTHRKHIQTKLKVNNAMEMLKIAMSVGLA